MWEIARNTVLGFVPIIVGAIALWLTPLKTVMMGWLWPETASIIFKIDTETPTVGQPVAGKLFIIPRSPAGVTAGIVNVSISSPCIRLDSASAIIAPGTLEPIEIPKGGFHFQPIAAGKAEIKCEFKSNRGNVFTASTIVTVSKPIDTGVPQEGDFSGRWKILLGPEGGIMELETVSSSVVGKYVLDNGTRGTISGAVDGATFRASFFKGASTQQWQTKASWKRNGDFMEISGTVNLLRAKDQTWEKIGGEETFYASVQLNKAVPPVPSPAWIDKFLKLKVDSIDVPNKEIPNLRICILEDKDPESPKHGLSLVWAIIPRSVAEWRIAEPRIFATTNETFNKVAASEDIIIANGGFFENKEDGTIAPIGLVIAGGGVKNVKADWQSGGIIQRDGSETKVINIASFNPEAAIAEALQSKPIVVKDGLSDIFNSRPEYFNRTAIGLDAARNYVCIGAFTENGDAVSLFEFAELLRRLRDIGGPNVRNALALDGGPSAHLYVPSIQRHFGYTAENYVPNVLRFSPKPGSQKQETAQPGGFSPTPEPSKQEAVEPGGFSPKAEPPKQQAVEPNGFSPTPEPPKQEEVELGAFSPKPEPQKAIGG